MQRAMWLGLACGVTLGTGVAAAQDGPVTVDPITVSAPRVERALQDTPAAVTVVDGETFRDGRQRLALDEALNRVPGLYFQNRYNFAQNLRLSTRGFGARAPFGIRGIRVRVDGFPETLPDGQSQIDAIDLDSITRAEVVRGPSSVLYGNATGGVIDLTTATGRDHPGTTLKADAGSYGLYRLGVQHGAASGPWAYHLSASALDYEGYRDQSETRKRLGNFSVSRELGDDRRLRAVLTLLDNPESEDPAGLTREEVRADRRQARSDAETLDSGQEVEQQRLGLIYEDDDVAGGRLTLRGFYTRRDFEQQLPFFFPGAENFVAFDRDFFGAGVEYASGASVAGRPLRYVAGVEADRQVDDRDRFRVDTDRQVVGRSQEEEQQATALGAFLQGDLDLTERWTLSLGVRADRIRFKVEDRFLEDGDQTGQRTFEELSGSAGLLYRLTPDHSLYATVSTAFETPTFTEFADENVGGLNPDIEPQDALNREIGARGFLGDDLRYELALFSVRVDDELVERADDAERAFFNNADTRREGVELGLEWFATEQITVTGAYTYGDYTFDRFVDNSGADLDGNRLPALPRHLLYLEAAWRGGRGFYAAVEGQVVGPVFADSANDVKVPGYGVWNLRGGREWRLASGRELELFAGINNLFDKEYFSNIRANASGDRFFEPAPEVNAYLGAALTF